MTVSDQNLNLTRYQVIPRVLIFAFRANTVLLLRLLPKNGKSTNWTGRYNGPGGHVECGEDLLTAARRELLEETGLKADLSLCGTIMVDTGQKVGIGLFIFRADNTSGNLAASAEGEPEWIPFEKVDEYPLVEDVAIILKRIYEMKAAGPPFSGRSFYDDHGKLKVVFGDEGLLNW